MSQVDSEGTVSAIGEEPAQSREHALVLELQKKPLGARFWGYTKLSGPGWLQSAITLGGGSLAGSLYLGVLAGFGLLWLQPVAMIMGVIMLSAISYVALVAKDRPFAAINKHINPALGWGWAIATLVANMVWCLPQFSLGVAAIRQNLLPSVLGDGAPMPEFWSKLIVSGSVLVVSIIVIWFYDTGARGVKFFENLLKVLVGLVVLSFFGVVAVITFKGVLNWGGVFRGFVPDLALLSHPAKTFTEALDAAGPFAEFWRTRIVNEQRDVMISAAATAVGINMTFVLPYTMLARGWNRHYRGLAIYDLALGLFIPFMLATSCVVIASASQFHTDYNRALVGEAPVGEVALEPTEAMIGQYEKLTAARITAEMGDEAAALPLEEIAARRADLPQADKRLAAMLVRRDAPDLAESLQPLTGPLFSHYVFGIGVVGMALSSIIMLMLISGFVVCEMLGIPPQGNPRRWACMISAVGALGPFIWTGKTMFWLAVPTSVFCMALLPIAYWAFFCLMNSRKVLGDAMPRGGTRFVWNVLMLVAAGLASCASIWVLWSKRGWVGIGVLLAYIALIAVVHFARRKPADAA